MMFRLLRMMHSVIHLQGIDGVKHQRGMMLDNLFVSSFIFC